MAGEVSILQYFHQENDSSNITVVSFPSPAAQCSVGLCKTFAKAWRRNFFLPPHHEPRTFKSHIYTLRLICTCSVAQALSTATFRTQKDVELTKLFKIAHRVVFRGRRTDFRDFKDRPKIACNSTKTKFFENPKVVSDSP